MLYRRHLHSAPAQYNTAQHGTAQHGTAQHSMAQRSTAQHSTARHSIAQHSTAQHSTAGRWHTSAPASPMRLSDKSSDVRYLFLCRASVSCRQEHCMMVVLISALFMWTKSCVNRQAEATKVCVCLRSLSHETARCLAAALHCSYVRKQLLCPMRSLQQSGADSLAVLSSCAK